MIPKNIVVIGSSSVYGENDPEGGGFVGRLKKWHDSNSPEHKVYNLGIGGDTIQGMISRVELEIPLRNPDLIIIYSGLNDIKRKGSPDAPMLSSFDDVRSKLEDLIEKSTQLCSTIIMGPIPPDPKKTQPIGKYYFLQSDVKEMSELLKEVSNQKNALFFDIFESWSSNPESINLLSDGLHCNPDGYSKLFNELKVFTESNF